MSWEKSIVDFCAGLETERRIKIASILLPHAVQAGLPRADQVAFEVADRFCDEMERRRKQAGAGPSAELSCSLPRREWEILLRTLCDDLGWDGHITDAIKEALD